MAEKKRKLLGPLVLTAGLVGGGVAGFVLGVPGVSGAQTTTTAPATEPTTVAPATGAPDTTQPDRPAGDPKNCPDKAGTGTASSTSGAATNTSAGVRSRGRSVV